MGYEYKKSGKPNETIQQRGAPFGALNRQLTHDRARFVHDLVNSAGGRCTVDIKPVFRRIWVPNVLEFDEENDDPNETSSASTTIRESCDLSFNQVAPGVPETSQQPTNTTNTTNSNTLGNSLQSQPVFMRGEDLVRHIGARRISDISSRSGKISYTAV